MLFASLAVDQRKVAQVVAVMLNQSRKASWERQGILRSLQFLGNSLSVARDGSLRLADQLGEARHSRMRPPPLMKA